MISPSTKADLIRRGIGADRIDVVLCGLDHGAYRVVGGVERERVPTLVHFGRMRKYKSIDVVIRAFARVREALPSARLLVVGDGPERENLIRFARGLGLGESVEFPGAVSTPDLVGILNRAHLFLNASPKEGWGLTVIEANACGLPVVASRRPGLQDSVKDGETGYLVEYGDVEAFARRSVELLTEPATWRRMSEAAIGVGAVAHVGPDGTRDEGHLSRRDRVGPGGETRMRPIGGRTRLLLKIARERGAARRSC